MTEQLAQKIAMVFLFAQVSLVFWLFIRNARKP